MLQVVGRVWAKLGGEKMLAWGAEGECGSWEHGDGKRTSGRVFCSSLEPSPQPLGSSGVIMEAMISPCSQVSQKPVRGKLRAAHLPNRSSQAPGS